jgi:DNA-binding CsgD family transcriptional regulator
VIKPAKFSAAIRPRRKPQDAAMFSELAWKEIARSLKLSARELQIVRGVFGDRTEFCIAADLGISPHTVHTHFERLHHKLGVPDRVKLVLRVMEEFIALTLATDSIMPSICANRAAGRCPLLDRRIRSAPPCRPAGHS